MTKQLETTRRGGQAPRVRRRSASGDRAVHRLRLVLSSLVVLGSAVSFVGITAGPASAALTITVTPNTGLSKGQSVTVTGSGFTANSIGNILECNTAPNMPTVALGSPVNASLPVGCTAPSYSHLLTVSGTGSINGTWAIVSGTIGPPCGVANAVISTCPSTDSAGKAPAADAANYPCPPTPAQQAAGVTCTLTYGDQANDSAVAVILFTGETAPSTTLPAATTTSAPAATTTTAGSGTGGSTATTAAGGSGSGSGGSTAASGSSGSGASPSTSPGGALPTTGPGTGAELTALVGGVLVVLGVGGLFLMPQSRRRPALARRRDDD